MVNNFRFAVQASGCSNAYTVGEWVVYRQAMGFLVKNVGHCSKMQQVKLNMCFEKLL